jgi:glycine hydroxymethyltransferase
VFRTGLKDCDQDVYDILEREVNRQKNNIILIASENYASKAVLEASGSVMTNKYAEGYPGARYYCGCEHVDEVETVAIDRAKKLFKCDHANVQPHAGTQANLAVLFSMLDLGDTVLSMNLNHGGHLSHGHPVNLSGKLFNIVSYSVDEKTERIDYDNVRKMAKEHKPKLIISGASSYPREIDFSKFGEIAEETGAMHMADIAHIGGLIVAEIHNTPVPVSDFVTTTNHKTLRGPRGGIIMCRARYAKKIDSLVFPGSQGGPFMHIIAAKAVAFKEAMEPDFVDYQKQIVANAKAMTDVIKDRGFRLVSGGTDNHLFLIDVSHNGLTGDAAATALDKAGITANKNVIPYDTKSPRITSGVRFGTPAVTTRGMKEGDVKVVANLICDVLDDIEDEAVISKTRGEVDDLLKDFPIYKK